MAVGQAWGVQVAFFGQKRLLDIVLVDIFSMSITTGHRHRNEFADIESAYRTDEPLLTVSVHGSKRAPWKPPSASALTVQALSPDALSPVEPLVEVIVRRGLEEGRVAGVQVTRVPVRQLAVLSLGRAERSRERPAAE